MSIICTYIDRRVTSVKTNLLVTLPDVNIYNVSMARNNNHVSPETPSRDELPKRFSCMVIIFVQLDLHVYLTNLTMFHLEQ